MKTLRSILDSLPDRDMRILTYAFEHGLSQAVDTDMPGVTIGVNMLKDGHTDILEQVGVWSLRERRANARIL